MYSRHIYLFAASKPAYSSRFFITAVMFIFGILAAPTSEV